MKTSFFSVLTAVCLLAAASAPAAFGQDNGRRSDRPVQGGAYRAPDRAQNPGAPGRRDRGAYTGAAANGGANGRADGSTNRGQEHHRYDHRRQDTRGQDPRRADPQGRDNRRPDARGHH